MKYEGIYKAIKAAKHVEGEGLTYEDIDKLLAETTDPGMKHTLEQTAHSFIIIDGEANINQAMEIPAGTPAEEIEKAKQSGMNVTEDGKYIVLKSYKGKVEEDNLYMYDATSFLAGTEWVKINTDVLDEINLVSAVYKKI